jgi:DNA-directed RNA polymerase specialized sigma24 family protein
LVSDSLRPARGKAPLTQVAFARLLTWLDDGVDSHGEMYLEIRRRLANYFDRRHRPAPDDLADETLNRIARTLEEVGEISVRPPARYCYVVARFVLLEDLRQREHTPLVFDEPWSIDALTNISGRRHESAEQTALRERRLDCLERCLEKLKPEQRELIIDYYRDTRRQKIERRREMAKRMGITTNALGIRACRIRDALEACVSACCEEEE